MNNESVMNNEITEVQASEVRELLSANLQDYKAKGTEISDKKWLENLFIREIPDITKGEAEAKADEILKSIDVFDSNLKSVNEAYENGISKEKWLADKIEEYSVGLSVNQYGQKLEMINQSMYQANMELYDALHRVSDGGAKMSLNLDGNIAEHMIAKTAQQSALIQGKNVKVDVREVFTKNSVDVRVINGDTGHYQNFQLKFGKDAKATIDLIERGNYNNQQIIVPSEQLSEVQAHFRAKGSEKTISDHIDAFGAKGKGFTKEEMKELQKSFQEEGITPEINYSHYETRELAVLIGKNAAVCALQAAAITTGLSVAQRICSGEKADSDELVEIAITSGSDTAVKIITAGTLETAVQKGIITVIPKATPAGVIANIACVGIENVKILYKIAKGDISLTRGIDSMGRATVSMAGGLMAMNKGALIGGALLSWLPGGIIAGGLIGGLAGYLAGSKVGDMVYSAGKKVAGTTKQLAKSAVNGLKKAGSKISSGIKSIGKSVKSLFS